MSFAIQRIQDELYYAGQQEVDGRTGFVWTHTRADAANYDSMDLAIAEARTVLHAAMDMDLQKPGRIPQGKDFDVEIVEL